MAITVTESNRHTLTVTDTDFQLTLQSGPAGPAGPTGPTGPASTVAGPQGPQGAAGPNSITSSTTSDGTADVDLSDVTAASITTSTALINTSLQMSGDQLFQDNKKIRLGSDDLQIYHDGSNSYIKEAGTGGLFIQGDTTITIEKTDGENMAEFIPDSAVNLYYDNVVKLATSATGVTTESIYLSGDLDLQDTSGANSGKIKIGSGDDLQLYHDGTQSIVNNLTGNLFISTLSADTDIIFNADNGSASVAEYFRLDGGLASSGTRYTTWPDNSRVTFGAGQDLQLYHDGTNSFIANSTGTLNIQGNTAFSGFIDLPDGSSSGGVLRFGANNDLMLYHDGSNSYIDDTGTGDLNVRGANLNLQKYTGETFIACVADGSVSVYHDNAAKLATTATGVSVTGNVISTGLIQHKVFTVAAGADQIPVATGLAGTRAFVSDSNHALANHHGSTLAGGGAHFVPVFSDGTNWIVG